MEKNLKINIEEHEGDEMLPCSVEGTEVKFLARTIDHAITKAERLCDNSKETSFPSSSSSQESSLQ